MRLALVRRWARALPFVSILATPAGAADWIVTNPVVVEAQTMTMDGSIVVESGGILTLRGTAVTFNNTAHGQHGIRVRTGGAMAVENQSLITAASNQARIFFTVEEGASLVIRDSEVRRCGWPTGATFGEGNGLHVKGSVILERSRFSEHQQVTLTSPGSGGQIVDNQFAADGDVEGHLSIMFRSGLTISRNTFAPNEWFGISLYQSDANVIRNNTFDRVGHGPVVFRRSSNNEFSGNQIMGGAGPYVMRRSANTVIVDNTFDGIEGIYVNNSDNVTIMRNVVTHGTAWGLLLAYSSGSVVADNTFSTTSGTRAGLAHIELHHASRNKIAGNRISSPRSEGELRERIGILLWGSSTRNLIRGNDVDAPRRGISIHYDSDANEVIENTVHPAREHSIVVEQSARNEIHHNNFLAGDRDPFDDTGSNRWDDGSAGNYWSDRGDLDVYPIPPLGRDSLPLSAPVAVQPPVVSPNPPLPQVDFDPQTLDVTRDLTITAQTVGPYGTVRVRQGARLTLQNATLLVLGFESGVSVERGGTLHVINSRIIPPTVEEGGYFFEARPESSLLIRNGEIRGVGAHPGCGDWYSGFIVSTSDVLIENSLFSDCSCAMSLAALNGVAAGNRITRSQNCIKGTSDINLTDNIVDRCLDIGLHGGDRTTMRRNQISNVWGRAMVAGADSTIAGNTVSSSEHGLQIYDRGVVEDNRFKNIESWALFNYGFEGLIRHNLFENNGGGVAGMGRSTYCLNTFAGNRVQARAIGGGNQWDCDGRGNYWSDYTGIDADGDQIGDSPYAIEGGERDDLPLMYSTFTKRRRAVRK